MNYVTDTQVCDPDPSSPCSCVNGQLSVEGKGETTGEDGGVGGDGQRGPTEGRIGLRRGAARAARRGGRGGGGGRSTRGASEPRGDRRGVAGASRTPSPDTDRHGRSSGAAITVISVSVPSQSRA